MHFKTVGTSIDLDKYKPDEVNNNWCYYPYLLNRI